MYFDSLKKSTAESVVPISYTRVKSDCSRDRNHGDVYPVNHFVTIYGSCQFTWPFDRSSEYDHSDRSNQLITASCRWRQPLHRRLTPWRIQFGKRSWFHWDAPNCRLQRHSILLIWKYIMIQPYIDTTSQCEGTQILKLTSGNTLNISHLG